MHKKKEVYLDCGHVVDADKVDTKRRKLECPGGCGWQKFRVVTHEQLDPEDMEQLVVKEVKVDSVSQFFDLEAGDMKGALELIAQSYPWETYEQGECVVDHPGVPTNRRIAREALRRQRGED